MNETQRTLHEESERQHELSVLSVKLREDFMRQDAIAALCRKTEKDALVEARRHMTKATKHEIIEAISMLETIKGKKYACQIAYAGIDETLFQGSITQAELSEWLETCKRTTFCNGTRFQPLPSHDEAWQVYSKVHSAMVPKVFSAQTLLYKPPVKFLDREIIEAARRGFWPDMSIVLRRRLFLLLPPGIKQEIKNTQPNPDYAMLATKDYYELGHE
jgi:hypothetical protein